MKVFKPILSGCMLSLCALAFSVQAQTSTDANNSTAAPSASSSTGSGTSSANNDPANTGSPNSGAISDSGDKANMPSNETNKSGDKTNKNNRHDANMKKCADLSGDAKATCKQNAKAHMDMNKSETKNKQ